MPLDTCKKTCIERIVIIKVSTLNRVMRKIILIILFQIGLTCKGQNIEANCSRIFNGLNCEIYYSGYFEYDGNHSDVIIYREKEYQIEYNIKKDEWITIKLEWTENCKYSFTFLNSNIENIQKYIGEKIDVEIIGTDASGYVYHSILRKEGKAFEGKIIFLKSELSKSVKRKILKKLSKTKS